MTAVRHGLVLILVLLPPAAPVEVRGFGFREPVVKVAAGGVVRWVNRDDILHTVTSGTPAQPDSAFAGSLGGRGAGFAHRFDRAGRYPYFCARHPFMRGEVRVITHTQGAR